MLQILRNAWKVIDLRKKLLYTLLIVLIFRVGSAIPVPFLDISELANFAKTLAGESGNLFGYMNMLTGDSFSKATLFALSIQPYINASIIVQLLAVAIPALQRWSKEEGEEGRRKINKLNRYVTFGLALMMAIGYYFTLRNNNIVNVTSGFYGWFAGITIVLSFVAGSSVIVWLGELINKNGIGSGISIILFAGIVSQLPSAAMALWEYFVKGDFIYKILVPVIIILAVVIVAFIVLMSDAERRIPVQYAKRVVGRKQYGGQSSYIPIKVNMSGVMPIIFASSIVSLPGIIVSFFQVESKFWQNFLAIFNYNTVLYAVVYFIFIILFNYFYVSIQYNPIEMANNLKKNNGAIPGYRAGKPTSDYIMKVLSKIILIGALFLGFVAVFPIAMQAITKMNLALGGTTVLIVVGVALETTKTLESQMMMRHYKGFLE